MKSLVSHLNRTHKISGDDYKSQFGETKLAIVSDEVRKRLSETSKKWMSDPENRLKMSNTQKEGGSIFSVNYWLKRGYSEFEAKRKISEIQTENANKSAEKYTHDRSVWRIEYWVDKYDMTEEEAKIEIYKLQSENSSKSSKFKGHIRTEESKRKISNSMKKLISQVGAAKWAKHFGKFNGTSKLEMEVYSQVKNNVSGDAESNIPIGPYIVDIISGNKIIEVNGDFWHANPEMYKADEIINEHLLPIKAKDKWKSDKLRKEYLISKGYDVIEIWENDWLNNKDEQINRINNFLR